MRIFYDDLAAFDRPNRLREECLMLLIRVYVVGHSLSIVGAMFFPCNFKGSLFISVFIILPLFLFGGKGQSNHNGMVFN